MGEASTKESGAKGRESPVPNGEFQFTWNDFKKIAELVYSEAGIVLNDSKVNLVYSRLAKRLRAIGLNSFRDYCALVEGEEGLDERQTMIAAMTTNVTRFFREPHHFEFLRQDVLPPLISKARSGQRVRIWSAGCSSGEEPYSIALSIFADMPDIGNCDFLLLASDIDHNMITRGREGIYTAKQIESIPQELRRGTLEPIEDKGNISYRIADELRSFVRFNELNLLEGWPMRGKFDVIFCRNTMIYFDEATQNGIWKRFAEAMNPRATLFIGHSERIATEHQPFDLVAQTTYRLRQGGRK